MNNKVSQAVNRLNRILPIRECLNNLDYDSSQIYQFVVKHFYEFGRAPSLVELKNRWPNAAEVIADLGRQDMLTLNDDGEVYGCYPFTMEKRVHRIKLNGVEAHAMCALDALAPSAMFECQSTVLSECAVSSAPICIQLEGEQVKNPAEAGGVFFGLNWQAASSCGNCSENLCTEMLFLKDRATAELWLKQDKESREVFTLAEAVEFSTGFSVPLMQQG